MWKSRRTSAMQGAREEEMEWSRFCSDSGLLRSGGCGSSAKDVPIATAKASSPGKVSSIDHFRPCFPGSYDSANQCLR